MVEPSVTGWNRLVMGRKAATIDGGLEARVHDPMWMLARQWQLGEFLGEDAGSPISARVALRVAPLTRYHPDSEIPSGSVEGLALTGHSPPLEPLVEAEPVHLRPAPTPRVGVEAGLRLLRDLRTVGLGQYTTLTTSAFPFPDGDGVDPRAVDPASARYLRLMRGRVPDGRAVYARCRAEPWDWPQGLGGTDDDVPLRTVLNSWARWYETHYDEPAPGRSAWDPSRQEYRFAVAGHDGVDESTFVAETYHGGRLDWDALEASPEVSLGATKDDPGPGRDTAPAVVVPAPLTYPGMPATRWWEMEDAAVNFGGLPAGPTDLVQMLFVDYMLTYANDWYLVPVELPYGTYTRVESLVVTDVFGVETQLDAISDTDGWRMYTPTGRDQCLLLPQVLAEGMESAPVEDVRLLRDEDANLAWGIEYLVEGVGGVAVDQHRAVHAERTEPPPVDAAAQPALRYRLATPVPANWFPFVPVRAEDGASMLRRGLLVGDGAAQDEATPLGQVFGPGTPLTVFDEEVPRTGIRVTRAYQHARGPDGTVHLWLGRRRRLAGNGDARSGLRFDVAEPAGSAPEPA